MRILLDTCVLSELRRPNPHPAVLHAVQAIGAEELFVSVISMGEISKGIALLKDGPKKHALVNWLRVLERSHADRILSVDLETSRIWGELTAVAQKAGRTLGAADGLIAATAVRHGLRVMTRNTADFEPAGILLFNPWPS